MCTIYPVYMNSENNKNCNKNQYQNNIEGKIGSYKYILSKCCNIAVEYPLFFVDGSPIERIGRRKTSLCAQHTHEIFLLHHEKDHPLFLTVATKKNIFFLFKALMFSEKPVRLEI